MRCTCSYLACKFNDGCGALYVEHNCIEYQLETLTFLLQRALFSDLALSLDFNPSMGFWTLPGITLTDMHVHKY